MGGVGSFFLFFFFSFSATLKFSFYPIHSRLKIFFLFLLKSNDHISNPASQLKFMFVSAARMRLSVQQPGRPGDQNAARQIFGSLVDFLPLFKHKK